MTYNAYNEEPKSFKKVLKLKGTYFWNIIYGLIIWQILFAIIFNLMSFILWNLIWNKWVFMGWRISILFGLILGFNWTFKDYEEEKYNMNKVVDNL